MHSEELIAALRLGGHLQDYAYRHVGAGGRVRLRSLRLWRCSGLAAAGRNVGRVDLAARRFLAFHCRTDAGSIAGVCGRAGQGQKCEDEGVAHERSLYKSSWNESYRTCAGERVESVNRKQHN